LLVAGGGVSSCDKGVGMASESGGASEVWHLALSRKKLTDIGPMTNSAMFFVRILQTVSI
jgi:hypothetical protein